MAPHPECLLGLVKKLRAAVKAERYLVVWVPESNEKLPDMQVVEAFGFASEAVLTQEPLSLGLLRRAHKERTLLWSGSQDAPEEGSITYLISGIQAYLCLPWIFEEGVALLYADDRRPTAAFNYTDALNAQNALRQPEAFRVTTGETPAGPPGNSLLASPSALTDVELSSVFGRFQAAIPGQRHLILLGPDADGRMSIACCSGLDPSHALSQGVLCLCAVQRACSSKTAFISKRAEELQVFDRTLLLRSKVKAVLCIPLLDSQNHVLGALYADSRQDERAFHYRDMEKVRKLAEPLRRPGPALLTPGD